jgi:hypothetical protein
MNTLEKIRNVEQGYVAATLVRNRDDFAAAKAISKIDRYTHGDPAMQAYVQYLQEDVENDSRNARRASEVFVKQYNASIADLKISQFAELYGVGMSGLSDEAKIRINRFISSDDLRDRTFGEIEDEILKANLVLQLNGSSDDEKKAAEETLDKFKVYNAVQKSLDQAYVTELSIPSIKEARTSQLEEIAMKGIVL